METSKPLISIIVPVYKVEESFLHRCIDSILTQTYPNTEIILVDDGSPDQCGAICDKFAHNDSRIHVIHQENQGVTKARAAGIQHATGFWIAFVDADDALPQKNVLSKMIQKATEQNLDILLGSSIDMTPDGVCSVNCNKVGSGIYNPVEYIQALLTAQCIFGPACKIIKKELFNDFTLNLPRSIYQNEDMYMNIALAIHARRIGIYNELHVYKYTMNSPSSVQKRGLMPEENWIELFNRIQNILVQNNLYHKVCREFVSYVNHAVLYKMLISQKQFANYNSMNIPIFTAFDKKVKKLNNNKLRWLLYLWKRKRKLS